MRWLLVALMLAGGTGALIAVPRPGDPFLAALDVGQGDSIVIDAGVGLMVDTGLRGSDALGKARETGSRPRALIVSHLHEDHAGDAAAVIASGIAAVFWNGRTDGSVYERISEAADASDVPLVAVGPGDVIRAGAATLRVLGPDSGYRTSADLNDTSLSLRADLPGFSALLTGDANLEGELALPAALVDVDVLKAGHHGSKTSSGEAFLKAASPRVAVISSGEGNRYGHPSREALARLSASGARIRRTDEEGTVRITAKDLGASAR